MTPFGREQMVFLSHSSLDKPEIEEIIPLLNGMDLPVWFDKYSIALGDSITDKVQEGIQQSSIVLFWITEHFLDSRWCKFEMRAFIKKLIEEDVRVISVLDRGIQISRLPLFLQDIKCLMREERTIYQVAQQIASALRPS